MNTPNTDAQPTPEFDTPVSAGQAERLAMLAEECGEVVQTIGKILRFGPRTRYHNRVALEEELLDLEAIVLAMGIAGDISDYYAATDDALLNRWKRKLPYTQHQGHLTSKREHGMLEGPLNYDGYEMPVKIPIKLNIRRSQKSVDIEAPALQCYGHGTDEVTARSDLIIAIVLTWVGLRNSPEVSLSMDGRKLREVFCVHTGVRSPLKGENLSRKSSPR